jgi:hypothetical protein
MSNLFRIESNEDGDDGNYNNVENTCNPNLSRWDVSKVTSFVSEHE